MKKLLTLITFVLITFASNAQSCPDSNHPHMIDLELPSGTIWACCNVDASKPEGYGGYYAWGEIETKSTYSWHNYKQCTGSEKTCHNIGNDIANTRYDVAYVKWGDSWVMPSHEQQVELFQKCTYTWTSMQGVKGGKFTSKTNGQSIFLPAAGYRCDGNLEDAGSYGTYWSSSQYPTFSYDAYGLNINSSYTGTHYYRRGYGRPVRPVSKKSLEKRKTVIICPDGNHPHKIDLGLPSGTKWACCNVGADSPEAYGGYYAWGETMTKTDYDWDTYKHCNKYIDTCHNLGRDIAGTQYDVAHMKWGGSWVMPTLKQIEELRINCKKRWTTNNGVYGMNFTGPNGNTIFLPAAGTRQNRNLVFDGDCGRYWNSTSVTSTSYSVNNAYNLYFDGHPLLTRSDELGNRCYGYSVRPVSNKLQTGINSKRENHIAADAAADAVEEAAVDELTAPSSFAASSTTPAAADKVKGAVGK